jgi:SAM-dependent methyltransferase
VRHNRPVSRFDGIYGAAYHGVVSNKPLRAALGMALWGRGNALEQLEGIVERAIAETPAGTLLDVPAGSGSLLGLLSQTPFEGTVIELDLSHAMLERGKSHARKHSNPKVDVTFLNGDALAMPLGDGAVDAAISINGLHCMPHMQQFCNELRRVIKPGGSLWLTTLTERSSLRQRAIVGVAHAAGVIPQLAPTLTSVVEMLEAAGFDDVEVLADNGLSALRAS